jgi:hypothetical protein
VTRRYNGPDLALIYPDERIVRALRLASAVGLLAAIGLAVLSGNMERAEATRARARQVPESAPNSAPELPAAECLAWLKKIVKHVGGTRSVSSAIRHE